MRYDEHRALSALESVTRSGEAPRRRPFVIGQLGQSLDGRIATPTGKSKYISGRAALAHLHRLRAAVDAVIVGVNTVIADDPQLTVRLVDGRSPLRVIIDPSGRLPAGLRCLDPATPGRTLAIRAQDGQSQDGQSQDGQSQDGQIQDGQAETETAYPGLETILLPREADGSLAPARILQALGERGVRSVLIEGGADTLSRALDAGVVDLLHVTVSPIILGSGKPGIVLPPIDDLEEGLHPCAEVHAFEDGDALFCCDLRRRRAAAGKPLDINLEAAE